MLARFKPCSGASYLHSRGRYGSLLLCLGCVSPEHFHTRKIVEASVSMNRDGLKDSGTMKSVMRQEYLQETPDIKVQIHVSIDPVTSINGLEQKVSERLIDLLLL